MRPFALEGHFDSVIHAISASPNRCTLIVALENGTIRTWEIERPMREAERFYKVYTNSTLLRFKASFPDQRPWDCFTRNPDWAWRITQAEVEQDPYSSAEAIFGKLEEMQDKVSYSSAGNANFVYDAYRYTNAYVLPFFCV